MAASLSANAQSGVKLQEGKVSFKSGTNIYVRFATTENISVGDTLYTGTAQGKKPCLLVKNKSSQSCVTSSINNCNPNKEVRVWARVKTIRQSPKLPVNKNSKPTTDTVSLSAGTDTTRSSSTALYRNGDNPYEQRITARISAASYTSGSSDLPNKGVTRYVSRLNLDARHINSSKFSVESYMNFRQIVRQDPDFVGDNSRFTIYSMAAHYDVDSTTRITLGRNINRYAASLGALDGAQIHKNFKHFYAGAIIGFQPAIADYSLDFNKLQYGAYGGLKWEKQNFYSKTTLGTLEQLNKGNVDRRFLYAQNSTNLWSKLFIFASSEMDLYQKLDSTAATTNASLTSLYLSTRYRINRHLSLFASYDTRKNVIYYDSYTSEVEQLLFEQAARQGLRFRVGFSNWNNITARMGYARRYQKNNANPSESFQASVGYRNLPYVKGRISARYLENRSAVFITKVQSYRFYRRLLNNKLQLSAYFRTLKYQYATQEIKGPSQNYYGAEANFDFNRDWTIGLMGEISTQDKLQNFRVNTRLIKRFTFQ